jgi:DNA polymerase-1
MVSKSSSSACELSEQFPYIRQLLDAYHIKRYELDNYEADDIIGTLSRQADEEDFEIWKLLT